jgi:hypothetical protein
MLIILYFSVWFGTPVCSQELLAGSQITPSMLCIDAKSATVYGETVDDNQDLMMEVVMDLLRKRLCMFMPQVLIPTVTLKAKIVHVAATDVWSVDWLGDTFFVALDAPRDTKL